MTQNNKEKKMTQNNSKFFVLTQDEETLYCIEGKNIYIVDFPKKGKESAFCIIVKEFDNRYLGVYNTLEEAKIVLKAIADSIMAGDRVFKMPS